MKCSNCGHINKTATDCSWLDCDGKLVDGGFIYLAYSGNTHRFCSQTCWDRMKTELADIEQYYKSKGYIR